MDPDLSEFLDPPKKGDCKVRTILGQLDDERAQKLRDALASDKVKTQKISDVLIGWGFPAGTSSIGRHRKKLRDKEGGCTCD